MRSYKHEHEHEQRWNQSLQPQQQLNIFTGVHTGHGRYLYTGCAISASSIFLHLSNILPIKSCLQLQQQLNCTRYHSKHFIFVQLWVTEARRALSNPCLLHQIFNSSQTYCAKTQQLEFFTKWLFIFPVSVVSPAPAWQLLCNLKQ